MIILMINVMCIIIIINIINVLIIVMVLIINDNISNEMCINIIIINNV